MFLRYPHMHMSELPDPLETLGFLEKTKEKVIFIVIILMHFSASHQLAVVAI
jgi:hypothetical protein